MDRSERDALLRLAGFALAHAMWSIEDGETLCTLSLTEPPDGPRILSRFESDSIDASLMQARTVLATAEGASALVFDGYAPDAHGVRRDALVAELYGTGGEPAGLVVQRYLPGARSRIPGRGRRATTLGPVEVRADFELAGAEAAVLGGVREHDHGERLFGLGPQRSH